MAENAIGISQALYKKHRLFDPVKQYDAIAKVATSPLVPGRRQQRAGHLGGGADRLLATVTAED